MPDSTTLYRFLRRLDEAVLERLLSAVVQRLVPPLDRQATAAVDGTGLAPGAISTFFVKRAKDRGEGFTWRHWLKWTMAVDVDRRLIVAQTARRGPYNAYATLRPLVDAAHQRVAIRLVLADAEFDSERNHQHLRHVLQAHSVVPAKRGGANWQIQGVRAHMRQDFPADLYRQRSLTESLISAVNVWADQLSGIASRRRPRGRSARKAHLVIGQPGSQALHLGGRLGQHRQELIHLKALLHSHKWLSRPQRPSLR